MKFLDQKLRDVQERREAQAAADATVHHIVSLRREIRQYLLRKLLAQLDRVDQELLFEEGLMLGELSAEGPSTPAATVSPPESGHGHAGANGAPPTTSGANALASPVARVVAALADSPTTRLVTFVTEHPGVLASEIHEALPEEPHVIERALREAARNGAITYRAGAWFPQMEEVAKAPPHKAIDPTTNGGRDEHRSTSSVREVTESANGATSSAAAAVAAVPLAAELPSAPEAVDLVGRPPTLRMIVRSVMRGQALRMSEIVAAVQRVRPEAKDRSVQGEVYILHRDLKELVICAYEARGPRYKLARDVPPGRGEDAKP